MALCLKLVLTLALIRVPLLKMGLETIADGDRDAEHTSSSNEYCLLNGPGPCSDSLTSNTRSFDALFMFKSLVAQVAALGSILSFDSEILTTIPTGAGVFRHRNYRVMEFGSRYYR